MNSLRPAERPFFIPLARDPYVWFRSGDKRWELRRYGRQFTEKHATPRRRVELRCGYRARQSALWGTITRVQRASSLREFFDQVPYGQVIPTASSRVEAEAMVSRILSLPTESAVILLGIEIELDARS